ncbi:MAG: efflux RND transporter permease subunit [Coriobacteriia bacterium]|nr:efflux RND transporter permease subunit [Coriobacteriia bacterium]
MFSKFSVKRPYIVIVAVIIVLILGGVSASRMKLDLLPEMDLPYLAVITTDVGASAEKVEQEVTNVIEGAVSTVSGVDTVSSISSDNFSLVFLQFQDGTNMDSALVKVSSAANEVAGQLPDTAGNPNFMEISVDMMATMYVAVGYEGKDIYQLSDFVDNTLVGSFERLDGVADVSPSGLVEQSVEVRLSDSKIEDINNRLLSEVNSQLYDAKKQIDDGKAALEDAKQQLEEQSAALSDTTSSTANQLGQAEAGLTLAISAQTAQVTVMAALVETINALQAAGIDFQQLVELAHSGGDIAEQIAQMAEQAGISADRLWDVVTFLRGVGSDITSVDQLNAQLSDATATLTEYQNQLAQVQSGSVSASVGLGSGTAQLAAAQTSIASSESELAAAEAQYEAARDSALASANVDKLVDKSTLAQIITAQNFSMPAGYVKDAEGTQWLLRVGDDLTDLEALRSLELVNLDGVGKVTLADVADITVIDNAGESYMKIDGKDGVLLSIFKSSTANASEVSTAVRNQISKLENQNDGLSMTIMSDQGSSIGFYIRTVLQSLILGALLAIVILALFLLDWKPTVIVAVSIPFSVLCALVILYLTNAGINIMSLAGISLAIGMLVDNSIIVMENIYRLRARGISAARAAVQGAKQIGGAVLASTLTTICVFLPVVFSTGVTNQLMVPFVLSLVYVLTASLVIALTLVPAVASLVFKNHAPKRVKWFETVQDKYATSLRWALRHKVVPLGVSVVLLAVAIYGVVTMGITLIPTMTSSVVSATVALPEDTTREAAFETADKVMDVAMNLDGVKTVGGMDGSASVSMLSADASAANADALVSSLTFYMVTDASVTTEGQIVDIQNQLVERTADLDCEVHTSQDASEGMSALLGSGLTVEVVGPDMTTLNDISRQVMDLVAEVPGYTNISDGSEDAAKELHLVIDKGALTEAGTTVAQLYVTLSSKLTTSAKSTTMTVDNYDMVVTVIDETNLITKENLLDTEVEITNTAGESSTHKLSEFATVEESTASTTISHSNGGRIISVTADVEDGYNNSLLSRELKPKLEAMDLPDGYTVTAAGELTNINTMLEQMLLMLLLGFIFIYLIMVAQFQSLLSPFIVILTVPLAFTGGLFGLVITGEGLSMLSLLGFAVLMGTIVNNGIVFVDYVNQLRIGGLEKRDALVATGRTRMRPILMTALTTILAMLPMVLSQAIGAGMERGMAIVVVGGLLYATLMTLYVVPCMYDLLYRKKPYYVDLGDENLEEDAGDAQEYLRTLQASAAQVEDRAWEQAAPAAEPAPAAGEGSDQEGEGHNADGRS